MCTHSLEVGCSKAKLQDVNQRHIKTFLTGLRAFQAGWFLCLFCRAEVTPWQSLCGGSAAPGGAEAHWAVWKVSLLSTWAGCNWKWQGDCCLPPVSPCVCVSASVYVCVCVCARRSAVALRAAMSSAFQIVSCGSSAVLQQKRILADFQWFAEQPLIGIKMWFWCAFWKWRPHFWDGCFLIFIYHKLDCSWQVSFVFQWISSFCFFVISVTVLVYLFIFFNCAEVFHTIWSHICLLVFLSVILCQIRALSGDAFLPTETKHWNVLLINSVDRVGCAF